MFRNRCASYSDTTIARPLLLHTTVNKLIFYNSTGWNLFLFDCSIQSIVIVLTIGQGESDVCACLAWCTCVWRFSFLSSLFWVVGSISNIDNCQPENSDILSLVPKVNTLLSIPIVGLTWELDGRTESSVRNIFAPWGLPSELIYIYASNYF